MNPEHEKILCVYMVPFSEKLKLIRSLDTETLREYRPALAHDQPTYNAVTAEIESRERPHWTVTPTFWVSVIAALAAIAAAYFAWLAIPPASEKVDPNVGVSRPIASPMQQSEQKKQ